MIVREIDDVYVFVAQHHHGEIAAHIMRQLADVFLQDEAFQDALFTAIQYHDVGWKYFDKEPFWNDAANRPYSFIDFPLPSKLVIYSYGVDQVEKIDPYAAALCSAHYTSFLQADPHPDVQQYIDNEKARRKRILATFPEVTPEIFAKHLATLQLADNLSLFACLHEFALRDTLHPFFTKGIPVPEKVAQIDAHYLPVKWADSATLYVCGLPAKLPIEITLCEKRLSKEAIDKHGLIPAYQHTAITERFLRIISA